MKPIDLSVEQGKNLLQMCDDLFPEYESIIFDSHLHTLTFLKNTGEYVKIHWFELCVVYLSERISESLNTVYPKEKYGFIIDLMMKKMLNFSVMEKKHPVDFLYEMYQKTFK